MGGFFGVTSKEDCVFDLFYGIDYHSHLGTRRAGMTVYSRESGFDKSIHSIENTQFRTKFAKDSQTMKGNYGIGCISDYEAQPILVRSHHGAFAITTVGKINNTDEIVDKILEQKVHFFQMQNGEINQTELVAAIINQKENIIEGIKYVQEIVDGSMSMLILTPKGIYAARDKYGRTPISIGKSDTGYCATFESYAYLNLGYTHHKELEAGEVIIMDELGVRTLVSPNKDMKICTFLWVYYGYPAATYEGISVEKMRYNCGRCLAKRDVENGMEKPDIVACVPDSGMAHAIGYSNESHTKFARPFVKYTPTWPRSFMPTHQSKRNLIAKMKLLPIHDLIKDKKMLLIDDSIVRGTQLSETAQFLYESGAQEVHIRTGCPPIMFSCKYLNFSRSTSEFDLITRRTINELEGREVTDAETLSNYIDPNDDKYIRMVECIRQKLNFTTLAYMRLDDMLESVGVDKSKLCTYCWSGKE